MVEVDPSGPVPVERITTQASEEGHDDPARSSKFSGGVGPVFATVRIAEVKIGAEPEFARSPATQPSDKAATASSRPDSAAMNACVVLSFLLFARTVDITEAAMAVAITKPT